MADLNGLLGQSDFITVHTPLNEQTRGLIGAEAFGRMKPGVRIMNCARGGIVDEKALAEAIKGGKVAGAALDVFDEEPPADRTLVELPQVVCTPHLAASTEEAQVTVAIAAAEQLVDALVHNEVRFAREPAQRGGGGDGAREAVSDAGGADGEHRGGAFGGEAAGDPAVIFGGSGGSGGGDDYGGVCRGSDTGDAGRAGEPGERAGGAGAAGGGPGGE